MDPRDLMSIARRWLWLLVLASAVAGIGAFVATLGMPRQYASQTTLMVGRSVKSLDPNAAEVYMTQQLARVYADMATREPVLQEVVDALGLPIDWLGLRGMVKASAVPGAQFVEIRVIDTDADRAQKLAAQVATQLIDQGPERSGSRDDRENAAFVRGQIATLTDKIDRAYQDLDDLDTAIGLASSAREIADLESRKRALEQQIETWGNRVAAYMTADQGSQTNSLSIIEAATPGYKVGPNVKMNVLFAVLLGLGLAIGAVLVIEYLDDTVKTEELLQRRLGLPGLATVERVANISRRRDGLVTIGAPRSPAAEAYRMLRTNLNFSLLSKPSGAVVVTSANPGEGKSTTAANMAIAAAQSGKRAILVDCDLRRPSIHRFFGFTNNLGMTSLLLDPSLGPADALRPVDEVAGLSVMTSGPLPPNPAEVLESPRLRALIDELRARADLVVMDTPPLLVVADGSITAGLADATVLVCESGLTRNEAVRKAVSVLARVGVKPIGVVINKLDPHRVGYYYYYDYAYRYSDYYGDHGDGDGDGAGEGDAAGGATSVRRRRSRRRHRTWWERLVDAVTSVL